MIQTMKRYTITGRSSPSPEDIIVYKGEFEPVAGQYDIITALAQEFANGDLNELNSWLGGNADPTDSEFSGNDCELVNDDSVFVIHIHD